MSADAPPATAVGDRVVLARLALRAAVGVEGIAGGHSGGGSLRRVTATGEEELTGVVVAAQGAGRYAVALHLVADRLVALPALAERVRDAVASRSRVVELADALGTIDIRFEDLEPASGEAAR